MNPWIAFAAGLFVGAPVGLFIMALLVAAARDGEAPEELREDWKPVEGTVVIDR